MKDTTKDGMQDIYEWHENGQKKKETHYTVYEDHSHQIGKSYEWDENGKKIREWGE